MREVGTGVQTGGADGVKVGERTQPGKSEQELETECSAECWGRESGPCVPCVSWVSLSFLMSMLLQTTFLSPYSFNDG